MPKPVQLEHVLGCAPPEHHIALGKVERADVELGLDTSPQLDLGVDSLDWLEIAHEVEAELGAAVDDQALAGAVTIRDLLTAVVARDVEAAAPDRAPRREVAWRRNRASGFAGAARSPTVGECEASPSARISRSTSSTLNTSVDAAT